MNMVDFRVLRPIKWNQKSFGLIKLRRRKKKGAKNLRIKDRLKGDERSRFEYEYGFQTPSTPSILSRIIRLSSIHLSEALFCKRAG